MIYFIFFFFQAEDGIRDRTVTGVQTCALPICVQGCYIGTNATGTAASANGTGGIRINASGITIGGTSAGSRNVISGNALTPNVQIGRASCRERVESSVVAGSLKKKKLEDHYSE